MMTGALWLIALWVAPSASSIAFGAIKLIAHLPTQPTREALVFFGVDKLMPLITAFLLVLIIYLVSVTSETIGELIPPRIVYAPANIALRVIGNVSANRLKVHFHSTSDQEVWDRAQEYVSGLDRSKSKGAIGADASKERESAARSTWYRSKFLILWTFVIIGFEWYTAGLRHLHWGRVLFTLSVFSVFSLVYFLMVLSAWKNYVWAVMSTAGFGITEDPADLDQKAKQLPVYDSTRTWPAFSLQWRPPFLLSLEPELFFNLRRFPFLARILTGRKQPQTRRPER
jgi:hypothetical protein